MRRRNPPHASQEKESKMRIGIIGGDQLLVDANERSHISYEDFAAAILDEIEEPRHIQRRFTVSY
jgi:putative NADH-flavin reductase